MTYKEREVILIDLQVEKMRLLFQSYERKRLSFKTIIAYIYAASASVFL